MKFFLVLFLCCAVLGCRRRKVEVPPAVPPLVEEAQPATPAPSAPSTHAVSVKPVGSHPGEPANPKEVRAAYHQYFAKVGSFPNGWPAMINQKLIPAVPPGKNGQPLDFKQFTLWEAGRPAN